MSIRFGTGGLEVSLFSLRGMSESEGTDVTCRCAHHHVVNTRRHTGAALILISGAAGEMKADAGSFGPQ